MKLNVGGQIYYSTRSTLSKSLYIKSLLSNDRPNHIIDGAIFIDRDGHLFEFVLSFMRTNIMSHATDYLRIIAGMKFYQLEQFMVQIKDNADVDENKTKLRNKIKFFD